MVFYFFAVLSTAERKLTSWHYFRSVSVDNAQLMSSKISFTRVRIGFTISLKQACKKHTNLDHFTNEVLEYLQDIFYTIYNLQLFTRRRLHIQVTVRLFLCQLETNVNTVVQASLFWTVAATDSS